MFLSLGCTIQTQCSPQAVISVKQCCLMSPLRNCSDSELIYLLLIRHKAKLCPHCARFLFWSCCSTLLHSMPQYAVLQHTLPYYALSFYLLFSLTLSAVLPLCSFCYCPPSQHSCILVYSWVEKESKREKEREREEVTCISGVGTVCKLPYKLKNRKCKWQQMYVNKVVAV